MNLDLDVQLQVALRALEDTVAPTLAGAEKHVVEQFHLALMTIGLVRTRLPDMRRYARMELSEYAALARETLDVLGSEAGLAAALNEADAIYAEPAADTAEIERSTRRLRDEVARVGSACSDPAVRDRLDRLVIERSGFLIGQARQWASPFGFELKPDELPAPAW